VTSPVSETRQEQENQMQTHSGVGPRRRLLTGLVVGALSFLSVSQATLADGLIDGGNGGLLMGNGGAITTVTDTVGVTGDDGLLGDATGGNTGLLGGEDGNLIDTDGVVDLDASLGQDNGGTAEGNTPPLLDVDLDLNTDSTSSGAVDGPLDSITGDTGIVDLDSATTVDLTVGGDDKLVDANANPDLDLTVGDNGNGGSIAHLEVDGNINGDVGGDDSLVDLDATDLDAELTIGDTGTGTTIANLGVTGDVNAEVGGENDLVNADVSNLDVSPNIGSVNDILSPLTGDLLGETTTGGILPGGVLGSSSLLDTPILTGGVDLDADATVGGEAGLVDANAEICIDLTVLGSNSQQCSVPQQGEGGGTGLLGGGVVGDVLGDLSLGDDNDLLGLGLTNNLNNDLTDDLLGDTLLGLDNGSCLDLTLVGPGGGSSCSSDVSEPNPAPGTPDDDGPNTPSTPNDPDGPNTPNTPNNPDGPNTPNDPDGPIGPDGFNGYVLLPNTDASFGGDGIDADINTGGQGNSNASGGNNGINGGINDGINDAGNGFDASSVTQLPAAGSGDAHVLPGLTTLFLLIAALALAGAGLVEHRTRDEVATSRRH
jgi:hypothetical protein